MQSMAIDNQNSLVALLVATGVFSRLTCTTDLALIYGQTSISLLYKFSCMNILHLVLNL